MEVHFEPVRIDDIHEEVGEQILSLPGVIDSFLEDHIWSSEHLRIFIGGRPAGLAAIHKESLITRFAIDPEHLSHAEAAFRALRRRDQVTSALVPTCDELFLSHAIDDHRRLIPQARFFRFDVKRGHAIPGDGELLRQAGSEHTEQLRSTGFFDRLEERLDKDELFVMERGGQVAGFGIREVSRFIVGRASIGMFVLEDHRRQGVGQAIIRLLICRCREEEIEAVAGCWYYNHRSRRTLERAGMASSTRLLRFEF